MHARSSGEEQESSGEGRTGARRTVSLSSSSSSPPPPTLSFIEKMLKTFFLPLAPNHHRFCSAMENYGLNGDAWATGRLET